MRERERERERERQRERDRERETEREVLSSCTALSPTFFVWEGVSNYWGGGGEGEGLQYQ